VVSILALLNGGMTASNRRIPVTVEELKIVQYSTSEVLEPSYRIGRPLSARTDGAIEGKAVWAADSLNYPKSAS
jgi:hypothetical protein